MHLWFIAILLLLSRGVSAEKLPPEVDLRAAYCLPIVEYLISLVQSDTVEPGEPDAKALVESSLVK
jgi:hypothetical protein